ncbi:MAG TPA: ATP-binding protein, partial [Acidimicrobiales bacterium]|nr:ATP-binding protein [Acidimicrobiales bacterium]
MVTIDREWPQVWTGGTASAGGPLVHGLIGRAREIALVDDLLASARAGTSGALAFRGGPGVGKTAVIQAAVARATGFSVLQLRGTRDRLQQGAHEDHPLAPVLESLDRGATRSASGDDDGGADAGEGLALGALREVMSESDRPLLVVIDDCHLLPERLPGMVVRAAVRPEVGGPVAVVLAWRTTPGTPTGDVDLPPSLRVRELGPLGYTEAEELFRRLEMRVPVRRVLECMVDATAGTPLALIETHGLLSAEQLKGERPIPWPLPIDARLAHAFDLESVIASEHGRLAAGVAALGAPTSVTVDALEELGLSLSSLGEAQRAGILRVLGDQIDFDRALVRAAAFAILPKTARDAVQLAVSNAYERAGDVQHSAFHAGMSGTAPTDVVVRRYAAAARYAMECGHPDHAAIYQEIASEHAGTRDAAAWHLATAAGLWLAIGDAERARVALVGARTRATSDETRA